MQKGDRAAADGGAGTAGGLLQVAARVPGAATSPAIDFLVPGLEGWHFVAYGSSNGSVVVACARQLDHIGTNSQDKEEEQQLHTLLVLDLHRPPAIEAVGISSSSSSSQGGGSPGSALAAAPAAAAAEPLDDAVLHVAFGGGPHVLLAAATKDTLAVVSLEGLAAHLFQRQTGGGTSPGQQSLWQQLATVHCGHADVLGISWTQQLDGILTSCSDGMLTMWHLIPLAPPGRPFQQHLQQPASGSSGGSTVQLPPAAAAATLRAAWSAHAPIPQRLVCAGVSVYAPSATAAGHAATAAGGGGSSCSSPLKDEMSSGTSTSSPARDSSGSERYVSIWWPQHREQRQRHYAAGMPAVGQEKLRHPAPVTGLQWSPGVLMKDALSGAPSGGGSAASQPEGEQAGSPTAAAVAATEAEDHPALMTVTDDGTVRIWVETLVLTENSSSSSSAMAAPEQGAPPGTQSPSKSSSGLQRLSPNRGPFHSPSGGATSSGAGSPGAAPSSPRDARAAAAAAAALGAAAPAITSYFCMALVIDPAAAAGPAASGMAAPQQQQQQGAALQRGEHVAVWARHAGPLLLHKQQRRAAAPVLWLLTATAEASDEGSDSCKLLLRLHAVRGLAAIVMSAGYGGSLSSTSGGSASTRPAAVLWGQHTWELPAGEAVGAASMSRLLHHLCCWVSEEESFPLVHAFTASSVSLSGSMLLAGTTFATVQEDGPMGMQVHRQLAVTSSWQAEAVAHAQPIIASAVGRCGRSNSQTVASCDSSGRLLLWTGPYLQHLTAVPAAAFGSAAALAWLPLQSATKAGSAVNEGLQSQQWLAVGSGSMLQCYAIHGKQAVAVATAAVPAGCRSICSLHVFQASTDSTGGSCTLLAVCSSSAGHGSVLCAWQCTAAPAAGSIVSSLMQLQLVGTAGIPGRGAAVTSAAVDGSEQLLLGAADGTVQLVSILLTGSGMQLEAAAVLKEDAAVTAVAADEGCLHAATASGSSISVWAAVPGSSNSSSGGLEPASSCCHSYSRDACVQLPHGAGHATAAAWLRCSVAPCLAVGTSSGSILLLCKAHNGHASWRWLAQLPPTGAGSSSGIKHLSAGIGCSSLVAAAGNQILKLSESVLLPPSGTEQPEEGSQLLGRLLLEGSGPLPQYHPTFLAALLLSGKPKAAAAILQRLATWLLALQQRGEADAVDAAMRQAPSPGAFTGAAASDRGGFGAGSEAPQPAFQDVPLAEFLDPQLMQLPQLLEQWVAAKPRGRPSARDLQAGSKHASGSLLTAASAQQQQAPASSLESGMLDMAAFGMAPAQPQPQQAPASSLESGMLDLAAFGMEPQPPQQQQQQPPASSLESGMLDMAAFGMAPPPAPTQQQAPASSLESGMLDLATFGMEPQPLPPQSQQAPASSLESGMLDMAAFGMEPPPPQQQQAPPASSLESGMLDLAAFGMAPPPASSQQQQQQAPASSLESGMLDLAAFGMAPAPAPTQQQQQAPASSLESGMLDLAAFGMEPQPPAAAAAAGHSAAAAAQLRAAGAAQMPPGRSGAARSIETRMAAPPLSQPLQQLLPVAADCYQQLRGLLLPPTEEDEGASSGMEGTAAWGLSSSKTGSSAVLDRAPTPVAAAIPGLSLAETSAVLAIAEAFCAAAAAQPTETRPNGSSSGPSLLLDSAAVHFAAAVSLAAATGGTECQNHSSSSSSSAPLQTAAPSQPTIMNAAGVAYTLPPSAVAAQREAGNIDASSVGQRWGLLPGLDATALLWAVLSGTEEHMLQQALQKVQQREAALSAAAAAAESTDAATFLAVRAASKAEQSQLPTWDQLRHIGAGFWLRQPQQLAGTSEQLAKQQFAARRNADDCALLYCALGKRSVLQGLYRSTQNRKLAEFLARDFQQEQHRQAAQKNAFVLLGQHRHELAAAFFILGGCPDEAIGVAANEMGDPQLALLLCRLLFGGVGSPAERRLLQQFQEQAAGSSCSDAAAAAAACHWLLGDDAAALGILLEKPRVTEGAAVPEHAAQLLPLLHAMLTTALPAGDEQHAEWRLQLQRCLWSTVAALQGCGLHALAVQAAAAGVQDSAGSRRGAGRQQHDALLLQQLLAVALLPVALQHQHHAEAEAAYQLELLQQQRLLLDAAAILTRLQAMRRSILSASQLQRAWVSPAGGLVRQLSGSSYRSRESEQPRWQQQSHRPALGTGGSTVVVGEGQVLFRVDGDKLESVVCCPLMSPDVLGRPVVVASHRHGLVEGQLHIVPPEPLSPLQEAPDSPEAAAAAALEEEQQRGGMFSRLLSQLFDQNSWHDPTWHHSTSEFDVVGAMPETPATSIMRSPYPYGTVPSSGINTCAMAAHPHKQLYITGCSSGRLHLWQFGEQHALSTYTPVPGSELASISRTFSGLLSFSRSFKQSASAPRLANWGKAAAVRFAPSGERFAAVGEGGVVATWRLDAPSRLADGDGHGCAEWWHQALSKQGCAVDFVGGSSSVLVVGGRCLPSSSASSSSTSSNLSVWDTMAPAASSCVGRLSHHQHMVTAVSMLPGGWLLAAGDSDGGLSCTDLRMMGGSSGPRVLWSVKAARGSLRSIAAIPSSGSSGSGATLHFGGGGDALLATTGADGAIRVWRGADGRLLQSIEAAHYSSRPGSAGSRRTSMEGSAPLSPGGGGHAPAGARPMPATGLVACEEGLVSCGADGCVRLFSFL